MEATRAKDLPALDPTRFNYAGGKHNAHSRLSKNLLCRRLITDHTNPYVEKEIEAEIAELTKALNSSIALAYEGMRLRL